MERSNIGVFRQKDLRERAARVTALRRRFEGASQQSGRRKQLAKAGRWLLAAFWCLCLTVIGAGLSKLHPEVGHRLAYALRNPAQDLTHPFPNCSAAHDAGYYDIPVGSPAYVERQDGDDDGLACEAYPHTTARERLSRIWGRWRSGAPGGAATPR